MAVEVNKPALPTGEAFQRNVANRQTYGKIWQGIFIGALVLSIIALLLLFYNIVRQSFTYVAIENTVEPATLADRPLEQLSEDELVAIIKEQINPNRLRVLILDEIVGAPQSEWATLNQLPLSEILSDDQYPEELGDVLFKDLTPEQAEAIMRQSVDAAKLQIIIVDEVIKPVVVRSWTLTDYLFNRDEIDAQIAEKHPNSVRELRPWINLDFLTNPMHSRPELAGLRTAIFGSIWMILITIAVAFPIGVGAAIYLEEYAAKNWLNKVIEVNISNLAGVPSIIYGILGLAIFVRAMDNITSGDLFGLASGGTISGRTILSAGLTMALLILPIIIINSREAIRAVPDSLRQASYGLGATKWQTIRDHVLPNAMPGIMTGTILSVSRAFGETAPLVVVGSITYITVDPSGPFSRFTAIPIQIYTWTAQPQDEFRSIAAAAIIVLLVMLLTLNSIAIIVRNRFSKRW